MASFSRQKFLGMCARVSGSKNPATGLLHGGIYYPACSKNGKHQSARFEVSIALNRRSYTDRAGVQQKAEPDYVKMVAFNGDDSKPGHGMADMLAKALTPGKEITVEGELRSGEKRLFVDGQPITDKAGNQVKYIAVNLVLTEMPIYGADSEKVIAAEIAAYAGLMNFTSRPQFWNVLGHADQAAWKAIAAWRNEQVWNGAATYGYARVIVPEGAVLDPVAGQVPGMPVAGALPTDAAAQMASMMALLQQQVAAMSPAAAPVLTPEQKAIQDAKDLLARVAAAGASSNGEDVPF